MKRSESLNWGLRSSKIGPSGYMGVELYCTLPCLNKHEMAVKLNCIADVCLIPIGTSTPSVSDYIVEVEKKIKASGLKSELHSAGTAIEGPWDEVMTLIGELHQTVHEMGIFRVQSDIRVGTRTDKTESIESKVNAVESKLEN